MNYLTAFEMIECYRIQKNSILEVVVKTSIVCLWLLITPLVSSNFS